MQRLESLDKGYEPVRAEHPALARGGAGDQERRLGCVALANADVLIGGVVTQGQELGEEEEHEQRAGYHGVQDQEDER